MFASLVDLLERVSARTSAAGSRDGALRACIEEVCGWTGWPLGHAYLAEHPTGLWSGASERYRPLMELTARTPLALGEGLPGRVLATGRPVWISVLEADERLPRRRAALDAGLRSAFAFPVEGAQAVLEFFSPEPSEPDEDLMAVCAHLGRQLGRHLDAMRVEDALRASERRFRSFAESAGDALVTADASGSIVGWNPAAEAMFGYTAAEAHGRPLSILMPERFRALHDAGLRRVVEHGVEASRLLGGTAEVVGQRKDGSEFPLELSLATWEAEEGRFFSGIIRDIGDRKRAEEHARALDSAPDAIVKVDESRRIMLANARAEALFGAGLAGRPVAELFAARTRVRAIQHYSSLRREELEVVGLRADGREFEAELLLSAEDGVVTSVIRDVSERKRFERRLRDLADHDALTGLLSRRRFEECLDGDGAVVVLGLDGFKYVNDTHGHVAGDDVLRTVAAALRAAVGPEDRLARLGGDEFAVRLDCADRDEAVRVATALVDAVAACRPLAGVPVRASAGVVLLSDAGDTLVAADLALHAAKESGGGRVHLTHSGDGRVAGMQARLARADQIRRALAEDRFLVYWQPIVELAGGEATQHELLLRMLGENGEVLAPGAFIEAAERFGLIRDLDRWVIRRAIRLLAERPDVRLEVNVSGSSVGDLSIPELVERELAERGVEPGRLVFEITETSAIADMEQAREFAERLTRLGCRFALDDFGAGFSSFHYLKYLPLDYLKIDGDFIRGIANSPTDQLVVKAMVDIARGMGMKTIAEFVEDAETVTMLRRLGVDFSQGYFHGRPEPVDGAGVVRITDAHPRDRQLGPPRRSAAARPA